MIASPSSVVKGSPNPNAAKAFADFMLSRDVQELFPSEFLYSARTDIAGPPGYPPLTSIKIAPGRLRLHRSGKLAHPQALRRGDAVAGNLALVIAPSPARGEGTAMNAVFVVSLSAAHNHGISEAWITSGTPLPPTERMARSTSLSPNLWVVTSSSGKRLEASCSSASSQAL